MVALSSDDVLDAVHAVMHLYRSLQHRALREGPHDLTHMEFKALGYFARHPGATLSDLVAHSGRDKAQIARLIGELKRRGLLAARADEADRRSSRLELTADGREVHGSLQRHSQRLADVAVTGLAQAEREQLLALLRRMRSNLETAG